eukprot:CFRG0270T1
MSMHVNQDIVKGIKLLLDPSPEAANQLRDMIVAYKASVQGKSASSSVAMSRTVPGRMPSDSDDTADPRQRPQPISSPSFNRDIPKGRTTTPLPITQPQSTQYSQQIQNRENQMHTQRQREREVRTFPVDIALQDVSSHTVGSSLINRTTSSGPANVPVLNTPSNIDVKLGTTSQIPPNSKSPTPPQRSGSLTDAESMSVRKKSNSHTGGMGGQGNIRTSTSPVSNRGQPHISTSESNENNPLKSSQTGSANTYTWEDMMTDSTSEKQNRTSLPISSKPTSALSVTSGERTTHKSKAAATTTQSVKDNSKNQTLIENISMEPKTITQSVGKLEQNGNRKTKQVSMLTDSESDECDSKTSAIYKRGPNRPKAAVSYVDKDELDVDNDEADNMEQPSDGDEKPFKISNSNAKKLKSNTLKPGIGSNAKSKATSKGTSKIKEISKNNTDIGLVEDTDTDEDIGTDRGNSSAEEFQPDLASVVKAGRHTRKEVERADVESESGSESDGDSESDDKGSSDSESGSEDDSPSPEKNLYASRRALRGRQNTSLKQQVRGRKNQSAPAKRKTTTEKGPHAKPGPRTKQRRIRISSSEDESSQEKTRDGSEPDDESTDGSEEFDTCAICGDDHDKERNRIVVCDGCNKGYHQKCHKPAIPNYLLGAEYEDEDWFCSKEECQAKAEEHSDSK